ncbi:MAG: prepilin-type N-terminal cleavage/methylation domain-containing protein [Planctomycetota bacterium]
MSRRRRSSRRGFTLIEASLAIVIVGTGCLAAMELFATVSISNKEARRLTVGSQLARHLEEAMAHLPYDDPITRSANWGPEPGETLDTFNDVDDFDGFDTEGTDGPVDALRLAIPELSQFSQVVEVTRVDDMTLSEPGTGALRIDVTVLWQAQPGSEQKEVARTSWYRMP